MNTFTPAPTGLQIERLHVAYPGAPAVVTDWRTTLPAGVTLLHGDTGSGKSTLLRVLAGEAPASGRLALAGISFDPVTLDTACTDAAGRAAWRRQVFWCDPATRAFDALPAREAAAAVTLGGPGLDAARWQALVDGFSLAPHLDKPMYMLSTGSKRKVWLAAALASQQALILLDEPAAALDGPSIVCLWAALADLGARGTQTAVVASGERLEQVPLAGTVVLPLR